MEYNFTTMGDAELLHTQFALDEELEGRLRNMIMDGKIEILYAQLEEVRDEKVKRGL
jgi:hypothetical protein